MKLNNKVKVATLAVAAVFGMLFSAEKTEAAKGDYGVDWAVYQGAEGKWGYPHDKFVIAQIGGYNQWGLYDQWTYKSQVSSAIAAGKRAHTYIWYEVGGSTELGRKTLDYFIPKLQTPKGSIVALDYESGASGNKAANTDAILYGMRRLKQAGYTPMYYSYKPFTIANVDYQRILREFPNSLWMAAYPDYNVTPRPNYNVFPSMDGVAIYQFTSTYIAGGLDGNVDLTGITDSGYSGNLPNTETPAVEQGESTESTPVTSVKAGDAVKVKFSATKWATGQGIPDWVKNNSYTVQQVSGNKVLLKDVFSWINVSDIELLNTSNTQKPATGMVRESGTFTSNTAVRVRTAPSLNAGITGQLNGIAISYDGYKIADGYVWIHYYNYSGQDRWMAVRKMGQSAWGTFR